MQHRMNMHKEPFLLVKSGQKKIETRLFDDKWKGIKVGDEIIFVSRENKEEITVVVQALRTFKKFQDLFLDFEPKLFGKNTKEELFSIYDYYTKDEENKFGVIAIIFKLS